MIRELVYVAGPYTKGDVALNVRQACAVGRKIWSLGLFSPVIPHLCHLWHLIAPEEYEFWLSYDLSFLPYCKYLVRIPGESSGADGEMIDARNLGLRVWEPPEEFYKWASI